MAFVFECSKVCNMSFNQQEILNKHKESHQGRKEFRCAHCQQSFRFKVSLKSHMINFHTESDGTVLDNIDRSLVCTECGKLFATRYKLRRHARCHTGERPYVCSYCNRTFSQTGNLKLHETKCQLNLVATCQISRLEESVGHSSLHRDHESHNLNGNLAYGQVEPSAMPITSGPSYSTVPNVMSLEAQQPSVQHFQHMYISESEIQKTINETLNSSSVDPESSSYLIKNYDNPMYIDDEIVTMLDRDLINLEPSKFASTIMHDKMQPATPELLHSLLYDD